MIVPPLDVEGQGRMATFADDQEALFAAWQPAAFPGCGLVNAPGCFCWSELACRDTGAAARFYGRVFGWEAQTSQMGPMTGTEWRLGGRAVGGMVGMDENWPEGVAPRWIVYFAVTDCDAAAALAAWPPGGGPPRGRPARAPGGDHRPGRRGLHHHQAGRGRCGPLTRQHWPRTLNPQASNPAERSPRGNPAPPGPQATVSGLSSAGMIWPAAAARAAR